MVELLISSAILIVAMGLITVMYVKASTIYIIANHENEVQKAANQIMSLMVDGIRGGAEGLKGAGQITKIDLSAASAPSLRQDIEFNDEAGNPIGFRLNTTDNIIEKDNTNPLWTDTDEFNIYYSDNVEVTQLLFFYFGNDVKSGGDVNLTYEIPPAPYSFGDSLDEVSDTEQANVTEILIKLTVQSTDPVKPQPITIYSSVKPRNIYKF